jgi:uncharacterized protein (TIGR02246 family)
MTPEEREAREVHSTSVHALNAGALDRLITLMADDVVFLDPGEAPPGREEFRARFSAGHEEFRIACSSELEEVVVVACVAYTRSRDALSVIPRASGEAAHLAGHRITIYPRQPDGRWLLDRDAHTHSPVEEPTSGV